ncbi:glycosyl hydrolase [Haloferula sargassicola]|uniref:Asl1-like glycosyl hydrolase catalytic domain-containing protein n=1 Tax=Haloferula sargassicola TaxID=490096 RepID=A0ABP9UJT3_9BACT
MLHRSLALLFALASLLPARQWVFQGIKEPVEAELVTEKNGFVVMTGANGKSFELPLENFTPANQAFIRIAAAKKEPAPFASPGKPIERTRDYKRREDERVTGTFLEIGPATEVHLTGADDPLRGSSVHFTAPDGWLVFENIRPSEVIEHFLDRMLVNGSAAEIDKNIRVNPYAGGAVVIPHGPDFPALNLFPSPGLSGTPTAFPIYDKPSSEDIPTAGSLVLKRGYTATLAENEDGSGFSINYVAQDHDVVIDPLPEGLGRRPKFVRVFPWNWCSKKGIAGGIHQGLDCGWFYDWNIGANSSPDLEYVAIRQNRHWPGMDQDWRHKGINHLLGFNEPHRPDQANLSVDDALAAWPVLLRTGLRVGSPAVSDGGLGWLYDFMNKADKAGLRVDFVAVHYYRAVPDPGDGRSAAAAMKRFIDDIHARTRRPIWITEWNNGANWTPHRDPSEKEQARAIADMIEMLDETPYVERYALYNWVEDGRKLKRDDGSLTPAGEVYRDRHSPVFFTQPRY